MQPLLKAVNLKRKGKKNMRKNHSWIVLTLVLAMLLAMLAGCGSTQSAVEEASAASASASEAAAGTGEAPAAEEPAAEPDQPAEDSGVEAEPEEEAADGSFTLTEADLPLVEETATFTWWTGVNPLVFQYIDSYSELPVMQYVEEQTNVHIDFTCVGMEADTLFPIMIAAGDYTDFLGNMSTYSGGPSGGIKDEIVIDMADLWEEYCPNYYARVMADDDYYHVVCSDDGEITGFGQLKYNGVTESGLVTRQDFLDKLGMDMPRTYDQLHDYLSAAKSELGVESPLWINPTGVSNMHSFSAGYGVAASNYENIKYIPYIVKDGVVSFSYTEPGMRDYLEMTSQWYEEGLIWKDFATGGNVWLFPFSQAYDDFLIGDMAVIYCESGDLTTIASSTDDKEMVLTAMPEPVVNEGDQIHTVPKANKISIVVCISTACEDVELACRYFDYYYTAEMEEIGSFGLEGQAYNLDEDGNKVFTDLITNNPDGMSTKVALTIYCFEDMPTASDYQRVLMISSPEAVDAMELWTADSDGAWNYPLSATFSSDESAEYASIYADISTYVTECIPQFVNGTLSVEKDYDEFQQNLKDMGIERCEEIRQQAYDRFMNK